PEPHVREEVFERELLAADFELLRVRLRLPDRPLVLGEAARARGLVSLRVLGALRGRDAHSSPPAGLRCVEHARHSGIGLPAGRLWPPGLERPERPDAAV